jgi:hypothetical protein
MGIEPTNNSQNFKFCRFAKLRTPALKMVQRMGVEPTKSHAFEASRFAKLRTSALKNGADDRNRTCKITSF